MKFEIVNRKQLTADIFSVEVLAPNVARHALPGHFVIVIVKQGGERIPLTIADYDRKKGTILLVVQVVGNTTRLMSTLQQGECLASMVGPLGRPSDLTEMTVEQLRQMRILFIAGGVGAAPVLPQVKYLHNLGIAVDVIVGSKSKQHLILEEEMKNYAARLVITTDDGSYGEKGLVTEALTRLVKEEGNHYDRVVAIGPMVMMKFVSQLTKELGIPTIVSLNSLMVDGTGMCGACRVSVGNKTRFTCVDGPEFDGHAVDYDEALVRQNAYKFIQGQQQAERQEAKEHHQCFVGGTHNDTPALDRFHRVPITEQPADVRNKNFEEVCLGYTLEEAMLEASRCLQCKKPACVTGCPVSISIPNFIKQVAVGNIPEAAAEIAKASCLPAVCGRVCPQETQCEAQCVLAKKGDAVSIGKLERFVADYMRQHHTPPFEEIKEKTGKKVAILGSGPAGLSAAGDLIKAGYDVTIYEALHESGGVLTYGIPEFRLPKSIVAYEIEQLLKQGVHLETDTVIGKTLTIEDLFEHEHFSAVFIATGAGLPKFMNIAGENLNGVYSANEFLTRNNLMKSYLPEAETPNFVGKHTVVVGGGNVAMDAARTALRLGAKVSIVYRRSEKELPARAEEVHHAKEEGIHFELLTNPVEIIGDENGWVKAVKCLRMQLGEPDEQGRRRPEPVAGSEFLIEADEVIMALGTSPSSLLISTTEGLDADKYGCVKTNAETGETSRKGIFCGGDAATGSATVILAMAAGRKAARAIDEYIKQQPA